MGAPFPLLPGVLNEPLPAILAGAPFDFHSVFVGLPDDVDQKLWPFVRISIAATGDVRLRVLPSNYDGGITAASEVDISAGGITFTLDRNATLQASSIPGVPAPGGGNRVSVMAWPAASPAYTTGIFRTAITAAGAGAVVVAVPPQGSLETYVTATDVPVAGDPTVTGAGIAFAVGPATLGGRPVPMGPVSNQDRITVTFLAALQAARFGFQVRFP